MSDISLRARFERFPATVKGAFVVRGEDAYPHQVAFHEARVVRAPGPGGQIIALAPVTLDVPPHKDLFVPFEFSIGEFEPGWYGLEADVEVDGERRAMPGGRRFCVPWPRAAVRSASFRVGRTVEVGNATVSLERCQSGPEGLMVRFSVQPSQDVVLRLTADGGRIDVADLEVDPHSGKGTARAYPLLRSHRSLRVEVATAKGRDSTAIDVDLPS